MLTNEMLRRDLLAIHRKKQKAYNLKFLVTVLVTHCLLKPCLYRFVQIVSTEDKMKTATVLLLTLCLSGVSIWAEMTPYSDICAEVGELRAMVENQLALSESKARAQETLVKDLKAELEVTKMELLRYKQQAEKMLKQLAGNEKQDEFTLMCWSE